MFHRRKENRVYNLDLLTECPWNVGGSEDRWPQRVYYNTVNETLILNLDEWKERKDLQPAFLLTWQEVRILLDESHPYLFYLLAAFLIRVEATSFFQLEKSRSYPWETVHHYLYHIASSSGFRPQQVLFTATLLCCSEKSKQLSCL